jgi:dTDP-glucose pyrophosphorylase
VLEAIKILDESSLKICFIISDKQQLLGTITDGDVRRGMLKGFGIKENVQKIMNPSPAFLTENEKNNELITKSKLKGINVLPILAKDKTVVGIKILSENRNMIINRTNRVVIMAGGLGKRLGELTKDLPKPMLRVGEKPILQVIIEKLKSYGLNKIYVSVNFQSHIIEDYFGNGEKFGVEIKYLREPNRLGTAGSLSLMDDDFDDPFLVINGDLLTNIDFSYLLNYFEAKSAFAVMCVREYDFQVPFGVVNVEDEQIKKIDEKPVQNFWVNAGVYMLSPKALRLIPKETYFDMPKLFDTMISTNKKIMAFPIREYWIDIGRIDDLEKAQSEAGLVVKD